MQPFGKYTAVTDCELSITGTLMTRLLTVDRKCGDFFLFYFGIDGVWGCRLMRAGHSYTLPRDSTLSE